MSCLNRALSSVHPSSVEGMKRIEAAKLHPKLVRDIRVELISQVWKTHILADIRIPRKWWAELDSNQRTR